MSRQILDLDGDNLSQNVTVQFHRYYLTQI